MELPCWEYNRRGDKEERKKRTTVIDNIKKEPCMRKGCME